MLSVAVDGVAERLLDTIGVVIQPALGALAFEFGPRRDGEPLKERIGLSDTVIQPPTVATRSKPRLPDGPHRLGEVFPALGRD